MNLSLQDGKLLDTRTQKFAFRRAIVVQDELEGQEGRSFLFEINNIRVFCGGMSSAACAYRSPLLTIASQVRTGSLQTPS